MRLGGFLYRAEYASDIELLLPNLDTYGLSTILAPRRLDLMGDGELEAFGGAARALGIVVGEAHFLVNLMNPDPETRSMRIGLARRLLQAADRMGCRAVLFPVGSIDANDRMHAPHSYMFTQKFKAEYREVVLRIVDQLNLTHTKLAIEPANTSFFFRPDEIAEFLGSVGHPHVGLHLDLVNMVDQYSYFDTTALIDTTVALLKQYVFAVHFKDIVWDVDANPVVAYGDTYHAYRLKLDEAQIGDGVVDYPALVRHLDALDDDLSCFCEHLPGEAEYALNFARVHAIARGEALRFVARRASGARDQSSVS